MCCAPFGGPVATVRDERQMVFVTAGGSVRPIIRTYAASGRTLGSHLWEKGRIVGWGWSGALELVVVDEAGKVLVLSMFGERLREFSMGEAVEKAGVSEVRTLSWPSGGERQELRDSCQSHCLCKPLPPPSQAIVYPDGIVVLTTDILSPQGPPPSGGDGTSAVWAVTSLSEPRPVLMAPLTQEAQRAIYASGKLPPMAVLEPRLTASGGLEVQLMVHPLPLRFLTPPRKLKNSLLSE